MAGGGKAGRAVWYRSSEGGGGEILAHGGQALVTDNRFLVEETVEDRLTIYGLKVGSRRMMSWSELVKSLFYMPGCRGERGGQWVLLLPAGQGGAGHQGGHQGLPQGGAGEEGQK